MALTLSFVTRMGHFCLGAEGSDLAKDLAKDQRYRLDHEDFISTEKVDAISVAEISAAFQ